MCNDSFMEIKSLLGSWEQLKGYFNLSLIYVLTGVDSF